MILGNCFNVHGELIKQFSPSFKLAHDVYSSKLVPGSLAGISPVDKYNKELWCHSLPVSTLELNYEQP